MHSLGTLAAKQTGLKVSSPSVASRGSSGEFMILLPQPIYHNLLTNSSTHAQFILSELHNAWSFTIICYTICLLPVYCLNTMIK